VRDYDSEWKDVMNWVVHGLIRAEGIGITQANVDQVAANPPNEEIARLLGVPSGAAQWRRSASAPWTQPGRR
jgi:general L-amino acid transport system substrate-binding protein